MSTPLPIAPSPVDSFRCDCGCLVTPGEIPCEPEHEKCPLAEHYDARPSMSAWDAARAEARPYAERIVAAKEFPSRFNRADLDHQVWLEINAIASTAISQGRSVEEVVRRHHPELFDVSEQQPNTKRRIAA